MSASKPLVKLYCPIAGMTALECPECRIYSTSYEECPITLLADALASHAGFNTPKEIRMWQAERKAHKEEYEALSKKERSS